MRNLATAIVSGISLCFALLALGAIVGSGQDVPYEEVAPEMRPVDAYGQPLVEVEPEVEASFAAIDEPLTADDIGSLERELESVKERYLIQQGWVKNPDNPGSLWLWSKTVTVDGRTRDYRLETDTALSVEYLLEPYVEPAPVEPQ